MHGQFPPGQPGDCQSQRRAGHAAAYNDHAHARAAAVAFTGQIDTTDKTLLAVSSGSNDNAAKGVGIEILDSKSTTLTPDGASFSATQALIKGTNTLNFTARYKATAATTEPGKANADATFVVKYE
jgi:major type 1 subunit fimbrin (pilin)